MTEIIVQEVLKAIIAAIKEEREACAKVAEALYAKGEIGPDIAAAIRARGAK